MLVTEYVHSGYFMWDIDTVKCLLLMLSCSFLNFSWSTFHCLLFYDPRWIGVAPVTLEALHLRFLAQPTVNDWTGLPSVTLLQNGRLDPRKLPHTFAFTTDNNPVCTCYSLSSPCIFAADVICCLHVHIKQDQHNINIQILHSNK